MSAESDLQTAAIRHARKAGLMVKRNYMGPGVETGWPDVEFFASRGDMFFIEFKAPGGTVSARQNHIIRKLRELGHPVFVCDSLEKAKEIVDAFR